MKLYDTARAPNPRRVRIFVAEKGTDVPIEDVDFGKAEQKSETFSALNPMQQTPVLVLDDGTVLSESIAICRYLEEQHPEPPLFGADQIGRAVVEMWNRRIEFHLFQTVMLTFRHSHPAAVKMGEAQIPALAESSKAKALDFLAHLDLELAKRPFIAGETFSIADITALVAVDFMRPARIDMPPLDNIKRWRTAVAARPSAVP